MAVFGYINFSLQNQFNFCWDIACKIYLNKKWIRNEKKIVTYYIFHKFTMAALGHHSGLSPISVILCGCSHNNIKKFWYYSHESKWRISRKNCQIKFWVYSNHSHQERYIFVIRIYVGIFNLTNGNQA